MTEQFYELLPFYLSIGMSYEQYWDGDCELVKYYRKAHELTKKRRNQELWLQGAYIYEALLDASPILRAFTKEGAKPIPYISEPFALTSDEVKEQKERAQKKAFEAGRAKFAAMVASINAKMKDKGVKQDG